jgi:hypothetical protein
LGRVKLQGIGRTLTGKGVSGTIALAYLSKMRLELKNLEESINDLTNQEQRRNSNLSFKGTDPMNGF